MLAKKQIEQAGLKHCQENNGNALELLGFIAGAKWAAEQMRDRLEAALSEKSEFTRRIIDDIDALRAENERLRADNHRLFEQADSLRANLDAIKLAWANRPI